MLPQRDVERRVAEHRRDVDRQVEQEPLHHLGLVQHPCEQAGDRLLALCVHAAPDAPLQRGRRVLAEVEAVLVEDAVEEQLELDRLEVQPPLGALLLHSYPYSHTRISESSWSVSTGLVM